MCFHESLWQYFQSFNKWVEGSYSLSEGMLISPDLKNPKEQVQQAAHSMMLDASSSHTDYETIGSYG